MKKTRFSDKNLKISRRLKKKTLISIHPKKKNKFLILDPGYAGGDIHIYEMKATISADRLEEFLRKELGNEELDPAGWNVSVFDASVEVSGEFFRKGSE